MGNNPNIEVSSMEEGKDLDLIKGQYNVKLQCKNNSDNTKGSYNLFHAFMQEDEPKGYVNSVGYVQNLEFTITSDARFQVPIKMERLMLCGDYFEFKNIIDCHLTGGQSYIGNLYSINANNEKVSN